MNDRQILWNDLLMGDGTPFHVQSVEGLHDTPGVRRGDTGRARRHGSFPGAEYLEARTITATIEIDGDDTSYSGDIWDDFSRAHVVAEGLVRPWQVKLPGLAGGRAIIVNARCARLALPTDQDYTQGQGHADVQWLAADPRLYDANETEVSTAVADAGATRELWPWEWPITWGGAASGGTMTATNEGEFPAPWTATLTGPLTNPRLELAGSGEYLRLDATIASGETVELDSIDESILLGGTVARDNWLRTGSSWFELAAGVNQLRFSAQAGTGSIAVTFRSVWI